MPAAIDVPVWARLRYEKGESLAKIAEDVGCTKRALEMRARKEKWAKGDRKAFAKNVKLVEKVEEQLDYLEQQRDLAPKEYVQLCRAIKAKIAQRLNTKKELTAGELGRLAMALTVLRDLEDSITGFLQIPAQEVGLVEETRSNGVEVEIGYQIIRAPTVETERPPED